MLVLQNIMKSRKAVIVVLSVVCLTVLTAMGKIDPKDMLDFIKITLPVWLGAQGLEDAAEKYNPVGGSTANVSVRDQATVNDEK